ncbi:MAG: hypothetical protein V4649_09495 [Bacteroidota bacterium]
MKKIYALFIGLAAAAPSFAQTTDAPVASDKAPVCYSFKSVNGHEVLPQQGDWALGVSATSFLGYIGDLMNGSTNNNAPTFNSANTPDAFGIGRLSGMAVMGKYMKRSDLAYRVRFQLNAGNVAYRNLVAKSLSSPDPLNPEYAEDKVSTTSYAVLLGGGIEKRRGSGRLQGIYGAEALLGVAGSSRSYTYGNDFTTAFTTPVSTTDFNAGTSAGATSRVLESSAGTMFLFGVRGFVGVEYFVAPKISLGGELGYTLGFSTYGENSVTTETWNPLTSSAVEIETEGFSNNGLRSFGIGLDNVNAGINLNFYF